MMADAVFNLSRTTEYVAWFEGIGYLCDPHDTPFSYDFADDISKAIRYPTLDTAEIETAEFVDAIDIREVQIELIITIVGNNQ
jgi:hypothetical protein